MSNCPACGRFMSIRTWYTNDHYDSEEWTNRCLNCPIKEPA